MNGPYAGETGTVQLSTAVDDSKDDSEWVAVVVLDSGTKEIQCFVNDLQVRCLPCPPPRPFVGRHVYTVYRRFHSSSRMSYVVSAAVVVAS